MVNHLDTVVNLKRQLEAAHVDLAGPCGAFEITKRVAWFLRGEGAGLLAKPSGNNCDGFATDIVMYADGALVDILSDSGGGNGPTWTVTGELRPLDQWRAPFFTPIPGAVDPGPVPPPDAGGSDDAIAALDQKLTILAVQADRNADAIMARNDANTEKIQQQLNQIVEDAESTLKQLLEELLPLILAGRPPTGEMPETSVIGRLLRR